MNTSSNNTWSKTGLSYKATAPNKSWDALRMRLENKQLKNRMNIYKKLSMAAVFFAILGAVSLIYIQNTNILQPTLAQKSNDSFEIENWKPIQETSIYNMSDLQGLKMVYDSGSQDTPKSINEI